MFVGEKHTINLDFSKLILSIQKKDNKVPASVHCKSIVVSFCSNQKPVGISEKMKNKIRE